MSLQVLKRLLSLLVIWLSPFETPPENVSRACLSSLLFEGIFLAASMFLPSFFADTNDLHVHDRYTYIRKVDLSGHLHKSCRFRLQKKHLQLGICNRAAERPVVAEGKKYNQAQKKKNKNSFAESVHFFYFFCTRIAGFSPLNGSFILQFQSRCLLQLEAATRANDLF